jgi:hypothetical protein
MVEVIFVGRCAPSVGALSDFDCPAFYDHIDGSGRSVRIRAGKMTKGAIVKR